MRRAWEDAWGGKRRRPFQCSHRPVLSWPCVPGRQRRGSIVLGLTCALASLGSQAAGYAVSRGLFTESFGLDRALAQRSMSSCPLTRHSDENVHPVADPALVEPLSECQNKPAEASARASATFTFYTYDGRAVTAAERFSGQHQSRPKTAWGVEYPPYSSHDLSLIHI